LLYYQFQVQNKKIVRTTLRLPCEHDFFVTLRIEFLDVILINGKVNVF
jgi:hypothetical protein